MNFKLPRLKLPSFKLPNQTKEFFVQPKIEKSILNQTKKEKNIIFGGQAIKAQIGPFGRYTIDFDIFSKNPKKSAMKTEKNLDMIWGGNHYYYKTAKHRGTHKVMSKGVDGRRGTRDDVGIADYSRTPSPPPRTRTIKGIKYRRLSQEKKAKYKALRDKQFKFRHKKDREDVERIKIVTGDSR